MIKARILHAGWVEGLAGLGVGGLLFRIRFVFFVFFGGSGL